MSSDFLLAMEASSRRRLAESIARCDESSLTRRAENRAPAPALNLSARGFDLIGEVKRRSPAMGRLAGDELSPVALALQYAEAGAAAVSVLTEPDRFGGDIDDLEQVAGALGSRPAMRKDFLVSPYQVLEARAAGAGGVLLIAAILDPAALREMLQTTCELGMFALVEAFDPADLDRCLPVMAEMESVPADQPCRLLIGINCRNLRTLEVEFERFEAMTEKLPAELPWVAESGVQMAEQAGRVAASGYRLALVGTALMRAADPFAAAAEMIAAGRDQARS
jgi:indole-3-glycerol phosphate synthase